jgi:uncharacterized membrane protein YhiD involved in acid resistance
VDVEGAQFAPIVKIQNPEVSDREGLSATIECNSPFDVDDDPSDNTATAIYVEESEGIVTTNNLLWGSAITILIVGAYLLVMQRKQAEVLQEALQSKPKAKKTKAEEEIEVIDEIEDDISLETIQEEIEYEEEPVSLVEEITDLETDLSPSGRLDTIRQELEPDVEVEETTSIEERMSDFFD